jgi:hypothetical protein
MPSGALSPYGAEVAALLEYVDARGASGVTGDTWAPALAKYFTDTYPGERKSSGRGAGSRSRGGLQGPCGPLAAARTRLICRGNTHRLPARTQATATKASRR